MNDTIGIVWNPSKIDGDRLAHAFAQAAKAAHLPDAVQWFETSPDDPGRGATERALEAGCTLVFAAGGDGTVRAVAEHLGRGGSPRADLGIVPLGTGNLFARNLGVPLGKPRRAFSHAFARPAKPYDLGMISAELADGGALEEGFVVIAGYGIDARMISETDDELKAKAGWLAYVESLGRAAEGTEVIGVDIAADGGEATADEAHTLLVGNCGTIQGGITLLPAAKPDDGRLDVLLLRADDARSWQDTLHNMVWQNGVKRMFASLAGHHEGAESSASTGHRQAERLQVRLSRPQPFEIDGDDVGEVAAFEARMLPGALRVRA